VQKIIEGSNICDQPSLRSPMEKTFIGEVTDILVTRTEDSSPDNQTHIDFEGPDDTASVPPSYYEKGIIQEPEKMVSLSIDRTTDPADPSLHLIEEEKQ